ncbi:DUF4111 domain-containing protein [Rhodovulum sulfidophilum]|nr:DUF4111 domain-containing protein [Rhodovulum sulfidophilum]
MCGLAARGLWVEMICLMHEATPYGHLRVNGQSPTDAQLGVLVGAAPDQITAMLGELEAAGVFSRTRAGVIYSRKLTRMAKKAATARNNGRRGGNPTLSKGKGNPVTDNPPDKGRDKPQKPEARVQKREDTNVSLSPGDDLGFHPVDEISEAVAAFNVAASESGWPQIRVLSKARRSALKSRLGECGGLWHTARTGKFFTKDTAATWAMRRLPDPDAMTLDHARGAYLGELAEDWQSRAGAARQVAGRMAEYVTRSL